MSRENTRTRLNPDPLRWGGGGFVWKTPPCIHTELLTERKVTRGQHDSLLTREYRTRHRRSIHVDISRVYRTADDRERAEKPGVKSERDLFRK